MSSVAAFAGEGGPGPGLGVLYEWLLGLAVRDEAQRVSAVPDPLLAELSDAVAPVWLATNGQRIAQILGEVALSVPFHKAVAPLIALAPTAPPGKLPPPSKRTLARLGRPTVDLLLQALAIVGTGLLEPGTSPAERDRRRAARVAFDEATPEVRSAVMHELVLGDLLPPRVSMTILTAMRGQTALLALIAAAASQHPVSEWQEWKGVRLGDIAVEGAREAVRIQGGIDVEAAATEHQAFKAATFARLNAPSSDGGGAESNETPAK